MPCLQSIFVLFFALQSKYLSKFYKSIAIFNRFSLLLLSKPTKFTKYNKEKIEDTVIMNCERWVFDKKNSLVQWSFNHSSIVLNARCLLWAGNIDNCCNFLIVERHLSTVTSSNCPNFRNWIVILLITHLCLHCSELTWNVGTENRTMIY